MYKISKNRSIVKNKETYVIIDNYFILNVNIKNLKYPMEFCLKSLIRKYFFFVTCNKNLFWY